MKLYLFFRVFVHFSKPVTFLIISYFSSSHSFPSEAPRYFFTCHLFRSFGVYSQLLLLFCCFSCTLIFSISFFRELLSYNLFFDLIVYENGKLYCVLVKGKIIFDLPIFLVLSEYFFYKYFFIAKIMRK